MNRKRTLSLSLLLLLAAVVTTTQSSSATAPDNGSSATGEGEFTFESQRFFVSFAVKANKNGHPTGSAEFDNLTTQTSVVMKIKCLNLDSFGVSMTGTVLHSDDPDFPKSANVIFAGTDGDNLDGRQDTITPLFILPDFFDCSTSPLTILPLEGDITINP